MPRRQRNVVHKWSVAYIKDMNSLHVLEELLRAWNRHRPMEFVRGTARKMRSYAKAAGRCEDPRTADQQPTGVSGRLRSKWQLSCGAVGHTRQIPEIAELRHDRSGTHD